jgi:hypothetical protein
LIRNRGFAAARSVFVTIVLSSWPGRPILNVIEKAGFSFAGFPKVQAYLETCRARPTWKETPKLPML